MKKFCVVVLLSSIWSGCAGLEASVVRQAGYASHCPEKDVQVLSFGPGEQSAEVNVCGRRALFQNFPIPTGRALVPNWVEVTRPADPAALVK